MPEKLYSVADCINFNKKITEFGFHVFVLQRTAKKCTKIYNVRAELLQRSETFFFFDVIVANAAVVG